jgi:hypothetical protein
MAQALQVSALQAGVTDTSGNPLSLGTATFYETDGTTLKTIWTDAEKTSTAANPITLTSSGTATVFADGTYNVVIKDSTSSTIYNWNSNFFNPNDPTAQDDIQAKDYGTTYNDTTIGLAVTAAGGDDRTVTLNVGEWSISDDLTIPSNINLKFVMGAYCTIAAAKTLTINGTIEAPLYNIFRGTGTVTYDDRNNNIPSIWPISGTHDDRVFYGATTFNESGLDKDFRIESDNVANFLVVDASQDNLGIGVTPASGPRLHIQKNDDGASTELLRIDRTSASVADNDNYLINLYHENDNDQQHLYGQIKLNIADASDTTESGEIIFSTANSTDGNLESLLTLNPTNIQTHELTTIDGHWQFDGTTMTAQTDANTTFTAYAGKNITIEAISFDDTAITSTGAIGLTPNAGSALVIDSYWSFDNNTVTALGDAQMQIILREGYGIDIQGNSTDSGDFTFQNTEAVSFTQRSSLNSDYSIGFSNNAHGYDITLQFNAEDTGGVLRTGELSWKSDEQEFNFNSHIVNNIGNLDTTERAIIDNDAVIVSERAQLANGGTLDITIPAASFIGYVSVTNIQEAGANTRTSRLYHVTGRYNDNVTITQVFTADGSTAGYAFTLTDNSTGSTNVLRVTNNGGGTSNASIAFFGSKGF